jgi:tetratricopeptide (TPR) repeat protein
MNRKQRRLAQSRKKNRAVIRLRGRSYTVEEASALAIKEYGLGNLSVAAELYNLILAKFPASAEAHNNLGVVLQMMKRHAEALASYDKAIALRPDHSGAYNSRGVTLRDMNRYAEALASYDKAIALKPDDAMAHNNRGVALQETKRYAEALASYDKAVALKSDCAEAHNNRGLTLIEMKRYAEALASCDRAIALKPDYATAHNSRGLVLQELRQYAEALAGCETAIALRPDYAEAHSNRGVLLRELKRYPEALASCDRAIALKPDCAEAYQNRGIILVDTGDMRGAEEMFVRALALRPNFSMPLFNLTKIRKYRDANHGDAGHIHRLLNDPGVSPGDRECLYFSLGKIYDDCGSYDEAFESYRRANQIRNSTVSYDPDSVSHATDSIIDVFSKDFLARPFPFASASRSPVFIVGMPRSGTTLAASILSNHRSIATAGELPTVAEFTLLLPKLLGRGVSYPGAAREITPAVASRLTNDYEKRLRRDVGPDVPYVIDKSPLNFRHLGLIAMLFPGARIIHCTRDPLDTGLSNYFQRFSLDYAYSFDLQNIGHFYGEYERLMEHWRAALPVKMIEVSYEDMITDTEQVARETLRSLGLEWDERCLAPHTNPCAVETASNWQVRQPIYGQSVQKWRHYEKHLAPLKEMLQLAKGHRYVRLHARVGTGAVPGART